MFAKLRLLAVGITLSLLGWLAYPGEARAESIEVNFNSYDGVVLYGKFYAGAKGKDLPTVLCLHGFNHKTGGNSNTKEWEGLALALQKEGHSVLTFDFRGHGKSTTVNNKFWEMDINKKLPGALNKGRKIGYAEFKTDYYPNLVNDIAAAKCFLDGRNDSLEANTSNLVVIGAGDGATLGAMWMASEWRRQACEVVEFNPGRSANIFIATPPSVKTSLLTAMTAVEPEGSKQLAAIWLTISPSVGNYKMSKVTNWVRDISMKRSPRRVQMVFVSGKEDKDGDEFSYKLMKIAKPGYSRDKKDKDKKEDKKNKTKSVEDTQAFTGEFSIDSKLEGDQLVPLATKRIVDYLAQVGKKEILTTHRKQGLEESNYAWFFGPLDKDGALPLPKGPKEGPFYFYLDNFSKTQTRTKTQTFTQTIVPAKVPKEKENIRPLPYKLMLDTN